MPKTIDELKQFIQEEWASVLKLSLKNLWERYMARVKKVIKLKGARFEPEHIKQLRKKRQEKYIWGKLAKKQKTKIVYNDQQLLKTKKEKLPFLKRKKKK